MFSDLLDALYSQLLDSNPFLDPAYFLAVSMSPDNKITEELNDISGRTIKTLSASDTNGIPGSNIIANYSYDMLGNVLVEIPPAAADSQQNTIYRYNTLGQLIYKRTPDCGDFEYNYRADGQLDFELSYNDITSQWDRKTGYEYDDLGRVTRIFVETPDSSVTVNNSVIDYYYDNADELKTKPVFSIIPERYYHNLTNLHGRMVGTIAVNFPGTERQIDVGEIFSYNSEGQIIRKYTVMGCSRFIRETVFTYDIHGKPVTESFCYSGDRIRKRYQYDELGRLTKVYNGKLQTDGSYLETELVNNSYDSLGQLNLTAGVRYYIELLHKEGNQDDNCSVGWLKPGQSGSVPSEIVPSSVLTPYIPDILPANLTNLTSTAISSHRINIT